MNIRTTSPRHHWHKFLCSIRSCYGGAATTTVLISSVTIAVSSTATVVSSVAAAVSSTVAVVSAAIAVVATIPRRMHSVRNDAILRFPFFNVIYSSTTYIYKYSRQHNLIEKIVFLFQTKCQINN